MLSRFSQKEHLTKAVQLMQNFFFLLFEDIFKLYDNKRNPMNPTHPLQGSNPVSLFEAFEEEYGTLCTDPNQLPTEDSDDDEINESDQYPKIIHSESVSGSDMTIATNYCGKDVRFKGNQFILWARDMMQRVVDVPKRDVKIGAALNAKEVTIENTDDWLVYEGLFDGFAHLLSKKSQPFYGVTKVFFCTLKCSRDDLRRMGDPLAEEREIPYSQKLFTTVEFRNKINSKLVNGQWIEEESDLLYAHIHDKNLITFLKNNHSKKYNYQSRHGLSYRDIVEVIEKFKLDLNVSDAEIAKQQLEVFRGNVKREGVVQDSVFALDLFLAYFNTILFGSESSRNSLSFITGILVLDMIAQNKLNYFECFQSPSSEDIKSNRKVPYSVYPMSSPHTGAKNFKAYKLLMDYSEAEKEDFHLSSNIGMESSRKRAKWSQIHLKEAILLKHWAKDFVKAPIGWINASAIKLGDGYETVEHGQAIEFARRFNQAVVSMLHQNYPMVQKQYVYSPDEKYALGWFKPSQKIWKEPNNPTNTQTDFNSLDWLLSTAQPLKLEKVMFDAIGDIIAEAYEDNYGDEMDE